MGAGQNTTKSLLDLWKKRGGYYQCPQDEKGRWLGPLVGYAGRYGADNKQYVGDQFYNFARVESDFQALDAFARVIAAKLRTHLKSRGYDRIDWCLGAPIGGLALAQALAREMECEYIYAEKKVVAVGTPSSREQSQLVMGRHQIPAGTVGVLVEDVVNNRSTINKAVELVRDAGAEVLAVVAALNRSELEVFNDSSGQPLETIAALFLPTRQWRQEDPVVAPEVKKGNVIWKPKDQWSRLAAAAGHFPPVI